MFQVVLFKAIVWVDRVCVLAPDVTEVTMPCGAWEWYIGVVVFYYLLG